MVKKDEPLGIFTKTEKPGQPPSSPPRPQAGDNADLDSGYVRPAGVGLRQGEIDALDRLAESYDLSRNSIIHYAVRRFLLDVRSGKIDLNELIETPPERKPKKRLRTPKQ